MRKGDFMTLGEKKLLTVGALLCIGLCVINVIMCLYFKNDSLHMEADLTQKSEEISQISVNLISTEGAMKKAKEAITLVQSQLDEITNKALVTGLDEDTVNQINRQLLIKSKAILLENGEELGLNIAYHEDSLTDKIMDKATNYLIGKVEGAIIDSLGLGKAKKIVSLVEKIQKFDSTVTKQYTPDSLIKMVTETLIVYSKDIDKYVSLTDEELTKEKLATCIASLELIGDTYDKLYTMTNTPNTTDTYWHEVGLELQEIYEEIMVNESKVTTNAKK